MNKYLKFNQYALSTKVILLFMLFIIILSIISFVVFTPILKQKAYDDKINEIQKTLISNKEQLKMAISSSRIQSILETNLNQTIIELELSKVFSNFQNNINIKQLQKVLKENKVISGCGTKIESIYGKVNQWNRIQYNEQSYDNSYFIYNKPIPNTKEVVSVQCDSMILKPNKQSFEAELKQRIKNTLASIESLDNVNMAIIWLNENETLKEYPLKNQQESRNKRENKLKALLDINYFPLTDFTLEELLNARNSKPIEHLQEDKSTLTWVIDITFDKPNKSFLFLYTMDKKSVLNKIENDVLVLMPETIISIVLLFALMFFILNKLFTNINKLTQTAISVRKGHTNTRSGVKGEDDVGILGEAFDSMLNYFQNSIQILDLKVEEKTKEISKSLEEKELLLKEIHHRVKNNLAMTIGMIELQERTIGDKESKKFLLNIKDRIYTMELLHRKLYESDNLDKIPMNEYIDELTHTIARTYDIEKQVDIDIRVDNMELNIEKAMPYGLILNELLTNAFKYAFKNHPHPKLIVSLQKEHDNTILIVKDNGHGLPEDFSIYNCKTLGVELIITIVDLQLFGNIECINDDGVEFKIIS